MASRALVFDDCVDNLVLHRDSNQNRYLWRHVRTHAETQTQTKPSMQSSARRGWEPVALVGANDAKQSLARTLSRVFVCVSTMSCLTLVLNWPAIASNGQQTRLGPGPAMRLNFPKRSITPILPVVTQSMQNGIFVFLSTSLAMTLGICQARSH